MMKKLLYSMTLALLPLSAAAIVASPDPVVLTQPDGSTVTALISGDEHHHIIRTTDGVMILRGADGFYRYAGLDAENNIAALGSVARNAELRSAAEVKEVAAIDRTSLLDRAQADRTGRLKARRNRVTPQTTAAPRRADDGITRLPGLCDKAFPSFGEQKAIVVLVEYQDVRFEVNDPKDYFTRMLNEEGFSDNGATGSARDYFIANSYGQFKPQFDVYGPILLKNVRSYYGGNDLWGSDAHPEMMGVEACEQLDATVDFTEYDRDHDGSIDNIFIFYAGGGEHDGGGEDAIWPHAAHLSSWIATEYVYDGVRFDGYGCTCERQTGYTRPAAIGTFVHEFSHVMGLPDLYTTEYNGAYTPAKYSVMDQGPYNHEGHTPPYYSSFERTALGWMQATEFGADGWYTLDPLHESNKCYIIPSDDPNEYFLLENRQNNGNDYYIPGHGMLVWRIDYDHDTWEANEVNNNTKLQRVDLIEADGTTYANYRSGHPFPGTGKVTSFGYDTTPALSFRNGTETKIQLSFITEDDFNQRIGFAYTTDGSGGASVSEIGQGADAFTVEGRSVIASENLSVYTVSGAAVASLASGQSAVLPAEGLYIVRTAGSSTKIMVK